MAENVTKNFLDYAGLTSYDTKIKTYIDTEDAKAIKFAKVSDDGNNLLLYKNTTGTGAPFITIPMGSSDLQDLVESLGEAVGATYDSSTNSFSVTFTGKGITTEDDVVSALNTVADEIGTIGSLTTTEKTDLVGAINEIVTKIAAMDSEAEIASETSGVVTLKAGLVETDGVVTNMPSAKSTIVEGYLYEGKFYEEDTHTTEITLETSKSYQDLSVGGKLYNYDGSKLIEAKKDIVLAKVATTGASADVSYSNTIGETVVTNVDDALDALAAASAGGVASKTVYITETAGGSEDAFSKRYGIYQGATGSSSSPVVGEKLTDIDIPKDMVVESGRVVEVTFVEGTGGAADKLTAPIGTAGADVDVTEEILGTGATPAETDAGQYILLIIANAASSHLWIKASDLVDIYTSGSVSTDDVVITISNNVITASIGTNGIASTKIKHTIAATYQQVTAEDEFDANETYYTKDGSTYTVDGDVTALNFADKVATGLYVEDTPESIETVQAAIDRLDAASSAGVDEKIATAIGALDASVLPFATYTAGQSGAADTIVINGGVKETDGVIEAGGGNTVTLQNITTAQIDALFNVAVTGVTLSPKTATLAPDGTQQLTATVAPDNATNKAVTYSTNDNTVATVSSEGLITAGEEGTATITVTTTDGSYTDTCTVTVSNS